MIVCGVKCQNKYAIFCHELIWWNIWFPVFCWLSWWWGSYKSKNRDNSDSFPKLSAEEHVNLFICWTSFNRWRFKLWSNFEEHLEKKEMPFWSRSRSRSGREKHLLNVTVFGLPEEYGKVDFPLFDSRAALNWSWKPIK